MDVDWQLLESGPADAHRTVLLLPGGMCAARSYAEVMSEQVLADLRLVAVTLPGHAGAAPPPGGPAVENLARLAAELAAQIRADAVVGFSMGASVALEMAASGVFSGPTVLLGASLSAADEPLFFRALVAAGHVLGPLPAAVLAKGAAAMVKQVPVAAERRNELRADFSANRPGDVRPALHAYIRWLHSAQSHAERLCRSGVPTWVVHAEKGDGGLTDRERRTFEKCPDVDVVTLPGSAFFLPVEAPGPVAEVIAKAVAAL